MRIGVSLPIRELRDDLGAIRAFAQQAEALGFAHLRVPEQIARKDPGHLHESLTLLAWVAAHTQTIELVPSVIVLPARQTVLFTKQAAEIDVLSGRPIPMWIGGASVPSRPVLERIARHADGWFALCAPEAYACIRAEIDGIAREAGRNPGLIGAESGIGVPGRSEAKWLGLVEARRATGVTHLCMRTLGGELGPSEHLALLADIRRRLDEAGAWR